MRDHDDASPTRLRPPGRRRYRLVDVFGERAFSGNPVAVVLDADGLSTEIMERFTRWTGLSEAAFILAPTVPEADYRVRIFTSASSTAARRDLGSELPFAGHPTLGACHAWVEATGSARSDGVIVQECPAGLVPVHQSSAGLAFAAPALIRSGPAEEQLVKHLARVLRVARADIVDAAWADNGPGWIVVLLRSAEAVLQLAPGFVDVDLGVVGPYPRGSPVAFEVRAFFPRNGATAEDPVTGSLNAAVAQWLLGSGRAKAPYLASQGTALGRAGRIRISARDGDIWVGGTTNTWVSGHVAL